MVKKIILWFFITVILVIGGLFAFLYYNQSYLEKQLVSELNNRLKVPVDVGAITVTPLSAFPNATFHFLNVVIQDPQDKNAVFATVEDIGFSLNIWELIKGEMVLEEISLLNAEVNIIRYENNQWSYYIYKETEKTESKNLSLDIKKLKLRNVKATYRSSIDETSWKGTVTNALASVQLKGPVTWINLDSEVASEKFTLKEYESLVNQNLEFDTEIVVDKHWRITTRNLSIDNSEFQLNINKNDSNILIDFDAVDATLRTLLALAPQQLNERLINYESSGNITLNTNWNYSLESKKTSMKGELLFKDASINQKDPKIEITGFFLNGKIDIADINELSTSSLTLNNIKGNINEVPFTAEMIMKDFKKPYLNFDYQGNMPLSLLSDLANLKLDNPSGILQINLTVAGELDDLKKKESLQSVRASGEVNISRISFGIPNRPYQLNAENGNIIFNNDHIAINDLGLDLGESSFNINGQLRNFWNITGNQPWSATADVYSSNLNLDQLLSAENKEAKTTNYEFNIPENISLKLNAKIDALAVRQFQAKNISGNISVLNSIITAEKLTFESMGGMVKLKGNWKDRDQLGSEINAAFLLSGIEAEELFYSFENFGQSFITNENLSGKIFADVESSLKLGTNLRFLPASLTATLNTKIVKGQLRDFEPLYHLEKYLNDADLSKVDFAELENKIYVQNEIVHLPLMPVGTNFVKFKIGGTHTFDQHINYDVVAPLVRKKRVDRDSRFGEIADDKHGESLLFLNIVGTTDEFDITIDKKALQQEIASDVKREVQDLQDAFKNKGKETEEVKLEEDDYFDWDEEN